MTVSGSAKIAENSAGGKGGGIYVEQGTVKMTGGSITKNTATTKGGGVYYTASNSLFVSGNVNITGNKDTSGADSNVNVPTSSAAIPPTTPFYIGEGGLDESARIGVRVGDGVITTGGHSPVACFAPYANETSAYHEGNFISDNGGAYGFKMEKKDANHTGITSTYVVNLYNGQPHIHPICGASHTEIGDHTGECANVTWTAWDGLAEITYDSETKIARVYLTTNAERTSALEIADG